MLSYADVPFRGAFPHSSFSERKREMNQDN